MIDTVSAAKYAAPDPGCRTSGPSRLPTRSSPPPRPRWASWAGRTSKRCAGSSPRSRTRAT